MTEAGLDYIDEHEEGELTDDDDNEAPEEVLNCNIKKVDPSPLGLDYPSSDDEYPDVAFSKYSQKVEERKQQLENCQQVEPEVDPKLCIVCQKVEFKYRCPRCDLRSCSLQCSKQHKSDNNCDGVRQPFTKVEKLSQYDSQHSIDDQSFMHQLKESVGLGAESSNNPTDIVASDGENEKPNDPNALRYNPNSGTERYLLNATRFRRIWLGFTNETVENESRHEQFSDTIFWTLKLVFRKQVDGNVEEFVKFVNNIPETIRLCTVLKQFFKPRKYGCIVSESDLDMTKLEPFIEKGQDNVNICMEVHGVPEKYYGVHADKTILESTRNCVIANHPTFVITLNDEFLDSQLLNQEEAEQISAKYGGISKGNDRFGKNVGGGGGGHRGGHRGGRGFHRGGGGRGGGQGGGQNNYGRKRPGQGNGGYDNGFKRGRGGGGGFRRGGGGYNRSNQNIDTFDPFEPFAGPTRLPKEYVGGN